MFSSSSRWFPSYYLIIVLFAVGVLSGCQNTEGLGAALFGASEHDKRMAQLDAERAKAGRKMDALDNSIRQYLQVSSSIQLGQNKKELLRVLLPTQVGLGHYGRTRDAFILDGKTIEIHYMRSARIPDGNKTDDEFTPYSFVDGTLTAIGWQSLGGPNTFGDVAASQRIQAAKVRLLLEFMGQQQQRQHQDRMRLEQQDQMQRLVTPPKPALQCRTQYFDNSSRTVCD